MGQVHGGDRLMAKQRWTVIPLDDAPLIRRGDTHVLLCTLTTDSERFVEVEIGDKAAAKRLGEDLLRWANRDD